VRSSIRVGLAAACLWAAGCTTPGKKADSADASPRPFTGTALTRPGGRDPGPPPEVDNLLAGQVIDRSFNRRVANASIQIVDLQDPNPAPAAKLDVKANGDGYFFIPGLQRGHHYQLIGRISDGTRILSGVTLAEPPNPRLAIYISEDYTSPTTPVPVGPPQLPGKPSADKEPGRAPATPSAALDPPAPVRPDLGPAAPPPALNRVADNPDAGGFPKAPPPVKMEIPSAPPNQIIPPPPPLPHSSGPDAPPSPPVDPAAHAEPPLRTAPPFCVLVGKHLDNFSLPDVDGASWEFRRDPPRKLVLVDFWKTNCGPCLSAIPRLRALQQKYGADGLEVVGIAYEDAESPTQRQFNVRAARTRLGINYTLLMGADSRAGACPVRSQFLVDSFPRLVLIDGGGDILWRSSPEGLSGSEFQDLERQITWTLHPPAR